MQSKATKHMALIQSICHVLFQFDPPALYAHLIIHWLHLVVLWYVVQVWCRLWTVSLLVALANADGDHSTAQSPSNERHKTADNCCDGCDSNWRQISVIWSKKIEDWIIFFVIKLLGYPYTLGQDLDQLHWRVYIQEYAAQRYYIFWHHL